MAYNPKLLKTDLTYIKKLEKWKPKQYKGLYDKTITLINEFDDIWAKRAMDRKTINVEPVRLGIKEGYSKTYVRTEQYPLNKEKRRNMINYTEECDKNGFWLKMECSINNNPYTMILKAPDMRGVKRGRPVFDFRKLNDICDLIESYMPTMSDFNEFFSQPGLMTTLYSIAQG